MIDRGLLFAVFWSNLVFKDRQLQGIIMVDQNREFFQCSCYAEGVILETDDLIEGKDGPYISLAFWSYGYSGITLSLRDRLRWCWKILCDGLPWTDSVLLDKTEGKRLGEAILKRVDDEGSKKI